MCVSDSYLKKEEITYIKFLCPVLFAMKDWLLIKIYILERNIYMKWTWSYLHQNVFSLIIKMDVYGAEVDRWLMEFAFGLECVQIKYK